MGFAIEHNIQQLQEREVTGTQLDAAVDCWFTSTGRSMPHIVKIKAESGEILTIENIRIMKEEQKNYAGIPARKYWCEAADNGQIKQFYLMFYPNENKWKMII